MKTKISIKTPSFNERRMGKPWIALVDFTDPKGTFTFGDWIGDARNGSEGLLEIDARNGDIIARGQKDNRQPRNSSPDFYQVCQGTLSPCASKAEALLAWRTEQSRRAEARPEGCAVEDAHRAGPFAAFSDEEIVAECVRRHLMGAVAAHS